MKLTLEEFKDFATNTVPGELLSVYLVGYLTKETGSIEKSLGSVRTKYLEKDIHLGEPQLSPSGRLTFSLTARVSVFETAYVSIYLLPAV